MGEWILRLLVLPMFMLFAGIIWLRCPPEQGSILGIKVKGYTTQKEVWYYAQRLFAKLMAVSGILTMLMTWICVLATGSTDGDAAFETASAIFALQLLGLYLPVFITRSKVKSKCESEKTFSELK